MSVPFNMAALMVAVRLVRVLTNSEDWICLVKAPLRWNKEYRLPLITTIVELKAARASTFPRCPGKNFLILVSTDFLFMLVDSRDRVDEF